MAVGLSRVRRVSFFVIGQQKIKMTNELEIATENLYKTFSKYPFKSTIEGCPCCVTDSDKSTLHSKQLRELEDEDLSRYAFKAMSTWGDVKDYKHYLPRIFELTARRELIVDTFVTLQKLEDGKWKEWDANEKSTIIKFLKEWWKYDINNASYFDSEILIELHNKINDFPSMLMDWDLDIETQGFKNYIELIENHYYELADRNLTFKMLTDVQVKYFKTWIETNSKKLEEGFFKYETEDKKLSERISNSLYMIERLNLNQSNEV